MTQERVALVGGQVWTAGYDRPRGYDILVAGNTIEAVSPRSVSDRGDAWSAAKVVDMSGKLIVPGFQDAHLHAAIGGRDLLTCDLTGLVSGEEVLEKIRVYAEANPELPWIIGGGWFRGAFPYPEGPTREQLDAVVQGRPAVFSPFDRHGLWVSSAVLELAGIDASTPDPEAGYFRRDSAGVPTGMVEESAMELVRTVMPPVVEADLREAMLETQRFLHSLGVTSFQDALVGEGLGMPDQHGAFCSLLRDDEFTIRVTTALWWEPTRGVEQIPELVARRAALEASAPDERVVADTVKMMIDGAGVMFMGEAQIREAVVALDAHGFSVHFHSYGDDSTSWALNAIEAARAINGPSERHYHIAHLFVVSEADRVRFAKLGVSANVQGLWAGSGVAHDTLCGSSIEHPELQEFPFGRLHAVGAPLCAGSDWPVTSADPLEAIRTAAGVEPLPAGAALVPEEDRLDVNAMLTAYTAGSAHVNGRGTTTGRIAPGFFADFAVLDQLTLHDAESLVAAKVVETWVDGVRVYAAA